MDSFLHDVTAQMRDCEQSLEHRVPRKTIRHWMTSQDADTLGAVYAFIMDHRFYSRIDPPLNFEDYRPFVLRYFEICLRYDPQSPWADSRYSAGHTMAGWFRGLWSNTDTPLEALHEIRSWLARMYQDGGPEIQECLVTACLEHLFESPEVAAFFSDWASDPVLQVAYHEATSWSSKEK